MTRIAILSREQMNAEQGKMYDDIKSEGGPLGGPYWAYFRHPQLVRHLQDTSNYLGRSGGLSKRERQMAIMAIIRFWGAKYPWAVQTRAALAMGISQEIIDTINDGGTPQLDDPREKMAYEVAVEMLNTRNLSQQGYERACAIFNEGEMVTLIATVGQFSMTCLTAIGFDCTPPDDVPHRIRK